MKLLFLANLGKIIRPLTEFVNGLGTASQLRLAVLLFA